MERVNMGSYRRVFGFKEDEYREKVHPDDQELVDDFLGQQSHLSDQTIKQYRSNLMIFLKWNHDKNRNKRLIELKPRDGLRFQNYMLNLGLSTSIIKLRRSTVSSFYGYVEVFWPDEYPDVRNIYSQAVPTVGNRAKNEKEPLTLEEVEKITKELEKREEWQKLAYFWFSIGSGARREEVRQIKKEVSTYDKFERDGEQKNYYLSNKVRAKGQGREGKIRRHYITEEAMKYIKKWVDYREENYPYDESDYLFVTINMTREEVSQVSAGMFNVWCNEFSEHIDGKRVFPHLLRSTRATLLSEEGVDIRAIQQLLGHADASTTQIYIVSDDDEIDDIFE